MRRIRSIEALDIIIPWNKSGFYYIDLKYGLIPPKRESPTENGLPRIAASFSAKNTFTRDDFRNSEYFASRNVFTISTLQSRD